MLRRSGFAFLVLFVACGAACSDDGLQATSDDGGVDQGVEALDGSSTDDAGELIFDDGGVLEPDGGLPPGIDGGTGTLSCGNMSCDVGSGKICCLTFSMMQVVASCEDPGTCMGAQRTCDGPEDCTAGSSCCVSFSGSTSCAMPCPQFQADACHTIADCPAPPPNRVNACCPVLGSMTLRTCRNFFNAGMIPGSCN